jgi:hypothetical protein
MNREIWMALAIAGAAVVPGVAQYASGTVPYGAKPLHQIPGGTVVVPESSIPKGPGRAHTHLEYVVPPKLPGLPPDCRSSAACTKNGSGSSLN